MNFEWCWKLRCCNWIPQISKKSVVVMHHFLDNSLRAYCASLQSSSKYSIKSSVLVTVLANVVSIHMEENKRLLKRWKQRRQFFATEIFWVSGSSTIQTANSMVDSLWWVWCPNEFLCWSVALVSQCHGRVYDVFSITTYTHKPKKQNSDSQTSLLLSQGREAPEQLVSCNGWTENQLWLTYGCTENK